MTRALLPLALALAACRGPTILPDTGDPAEPASDTAETEVEPDDTAANDDGCDRPYTGGARIGDVTDSAEAVIGQAWLDDRCSATLFLSAPLDVSAYPTPSIRIDNGDQVLAIATIEARAYAANETITASWNPAEHNDVPFASDGAMILFVLDRDDRSLPYWSSEVLTAP